MPPPRRNNLEPYDRFVEAVARQNDEKRRRQEERDQAEVLAAGFEDMPHLDATPVPHDLNDQSYRRQLSAIANAQIDNHPRNRNPQEQVAQQEAQERVQEANPLPKPPLARHQPHDTRRTDIGDIRHGGREQVNPNSEVAATLERQEADAEVPAKRPKVDQPEAQPPAVPADTGPAQGQGAAAVQQLIASDADGGFSESKMEVDARNVSSPTGEGSGATHPGGSMLQNTIGPAGGKTHTQTFRHCGSFFIEDNATHNSWCNFPAAYPRLFIGNRDLLSNILQYDRWRTKRISFTFKNPLQRYTYTNTTGSTITATDPSARVLFWIDSSRHHGVSTHPGWTDGDHTNFTNSSAYGGFNSVTNAAWHLPVKTEFHSNDKNTPLDEHTADFAPDVVSMNCNSGGELRRDYYPSDYTWRHCDELACDPTLMPTASSLNYTTVSQPTLVQVPDAKAYLVPRGDNFMCLRVSPYSCKLPYGGATTAKALTYTSTVWAIQQVKDASSGVASHNKWENQPTFIWTDIPTTTSTLATIYPECNEMHPMPETWISYRNMVGVDGESYMNQKIQIDFEYEWVVEFGGATKPKINHQTDTAGFKYEFTNDTGVMGPRFRYLGSFRKKPISMLDMCRPYAIPFYITHDNTKGDGAKTTNTNMDTNNLMDPLTLMNTYSNPNLNPYF